MIVIVEFVGGLRILANTDKRTIALEEPATISTLMSRLRSELCSNGDELVEGSNLLIMKNEKEISALRGSQTELDSNDVITLIPVSHGG